MKMLNYDLWKSLKNERKMVKKFSHLIMYLRYDKDNSHMAWINIILMNCSIHDDD